jgi:WD40 repeat protein
VKLPRRGIISVAVSPDGNWLACAGYHDWPLRVWDVKGRRLAWAAPPVGAHPFVDAICFTADSRLLAAPAGQGGTRVELREAATGKIVRTFDTAPVEVGSAAVSPDGKYLAAASFGGKSAFFVWRLETGEALHDKYPGHHHHIYALAFTPNGKRVVSGCCNGTVRLWNAQTGRELYRMQHDDHATVLAIDVSPDGKRIASSAGDRSLRVWDSASGKQVFKLVGHSGSASFANDVKFTSDKTVLSFGSDLRLRAWDATHGRMRSEFDIRPNGLALVKTEEGELRLADNAEEGWLVRAVEASEMAGDGSRLLIDVHDALHVFDAATGAQLARIERAAPFGTKFAVSPDGKLLAALDIVKAPLREAALRVRELDTQILLSDIRLPLDSPRHIAFSRDGKLLAASISSSGRECPPGHVIFVWDVAKRREVGRITNIESPVCVAAFSPDGGRLASSHEDSTILIWDIAKLRKEERE